MKEILGVKCFTVAETAKELGVTAQTIRKYIKTNKIAAQRIGRGYYISEESIKSFLSPVLEKSSKQSKQ